MSKSYHVRNMNCFILFANTCPLSMCFDENIYTDVIQIAYNATVWSPSYFVASYNGVHAP